MAKAKKSGAVPETFVGQPREKLQGAYLAIIGYDPYLDDPRISDATVARTLDEWRHAAETSTSVSDENTIDNRCPQCSEYESECSCSEADQMAAALRQILALTDSPNSLADALDAIRTIAREHVGEATPSAPAVSP